MKGKARGRPVKYPMPDPIPDTPENILKAVLETPPKRRREWRFVREREARMGYEVYRSPRLRSAAANGRTW